VDHALQTKPNVDRVVSIGFCGALDPALRIGDIVVSGEFPEELGASFVQGDVLSVDRVAITAVEKGELRASTQAAVVEMESAAVARKARMGDAVWLRARGVGRRRREFAFGFQPLSGCGRTLQPDTDRASRYGHPFTVLPGLLRWIEIAAWLRNG
jgi:hypothetical protein